MRSLSTADLYPHSFRSRFPCNIWSVAFAAWFVSPQVRIYKRKNYIKHAFDKQKSKVQEKNDFYQEKRRIQEKKKKHAFDQEKK